MTTPNAVSDTDSYETCLEFLDRVVLYKFNYTLPGRDFISLGLFFFFFLFSLHPLDRPPLGIYRIVSKTL
jgi:hypothetical protein